MSGLVLHGYWRSSAAYRVRIALNLKGIAYQQVSHDLRQDAQRAADYLAIAPHGLVPALEADGQVLIESPAIIEWIEMRWPAPALLPADPADAAIVRAMAAIIACDIHPLCNLRVLRALKAMGRSQDEIDQWVRRWIGDGFAALEQMVACHGRGFCFGDTPTVADCHLVPQLYNAQRFALDLTPYPALVAAGAAAGALAAFAAAHPAAQPDADR
ncbi:maleylacetoacetate isomerase [Sphingobium sp. HBC34]|uniref:Maleylacetoacetate isomerase n=1 Tax=Sphingobium cyanobacteriorum TaxID=3063954 RepID=A0ABT8ZQ38_9SPHN|nr:maleylacetoacetate isomerase [Sphingobium sp. HBC34]MDO7836654.1 maleylacetoacetate isomerase [Sphingobium sp. HBC34]